MAKIQYLRNGDGDIVFPVTHERAIKDKDGNLLEDKLNALYNAISDTSGYIVTDVSGYATLRSLGHIDQHKWYFVSDDDNGELRSIYIGYICAASYNARLGVVTFGDTAKSAYDLAQDEGFTGTLQEWLNSLVGPPGPAGVDDINVSVDGDASLDPTVTTDFTDGVLSIHFSNLKGRTGTRGPAGVETAQVTVDALSGNPRAVADVNDGVLTISFYGLKGEQGIPGTNNAETIIVDALPQPPTDRTLNKVYWVMNSETGYYDQYVTQRLGDSWTWVRLGSTEIDLADYVRKDSEVWLTREEFDALPVKDLSVTYNIYEMASDV